MGRKRKVENLSTRTKQRRIKEAKDKANGSLSELSNTGKKKALKKIYSENKELIKELTEINPVTPEEAIALQKTKGFSLSLIHI